MTRPENFRDRMIAERKALSDKLDKLNHFLETDKFTMLGNRQQMLLLNQQFYMDGYLKTLTERINDVESISED